MWQPQICSVCGHVPLLIQTHFLSFPVLLRGPGGCTPGNLTQASHPWGLRLSCTNERCREELDWETTLPPCLGQASWPRL